MPCFAVESASILTLRLTLGDEKALEVLQHYDYNLEQIQTHSNQLGGMLE